MSNFAAVIRLWSGKVRDLGWPMKGQWTMPKVRYGCTYSAYIRHVPIPVKESKISSWKHNLVEKKVGGCFDSDDVALWPNLTPPRFLPRVAQGMSHILCAKFQHDSPSRSFQKTYGVGLSLPREEGRGGGVRRRLRVLMSSWMYYTPTESGKSATPSQISCGAAIHECVMMGLSVASM